MGYMRSVLGQAVYLGRAIGSTAGQSSLLGGIENGADLNCSPALDVKEVFRAWAQPVGPSTPPLSESGITYYRTRL
jgi:hypothetical protein